MKFLYCTDIHLKNKNPVNRLDNYYISVLEKIKEIVQIAKDQKCGIIICGGDLFDSPNVGNTTVDDFMDIVEESGIPWDIVPGNHDMNSHNWEQSKGSALAHMFRRSINICELTELAAWSEGEDGIQKGYYIEGYKYYHTIEEDFIKDGLLTDSKVDFKIAVPHVFISIKPFFKEVSHVCAKDLKTNYDLVLCSHFHMNFDETINGTRFLNTNSIGRTTISAQHMPEVAIIDTQTKDVEIIKLKVAKTVDEIFDLSKYEELKGKKKDIKEFLDSLKGVNFQGMNLGQQITKIGKENGVEDEVINYLLNKMEEVK